MYIVFVDKYTYILCIYVCCLFIFLLSFCAVIVLLRIKMYNSTTVLFCWIFLTTQLHFRFRWLLITVLRLPTVRNSLFSYHLYGSGFYVATDAGVNKSPRSLTRSRKRLQPRIKRHPIAGSFSSQSQLCTSFPSRVANGDECAACETAPSACSSGGGGGIACFRHQPATPQTT